MDDDALPCTARRLYPEDEWSPWLVKQGEKVRAMIPASPTAERDAERIARMLNAEGE